MFQCHSARKLWCEIPFGNLIWFQNGEQQVSSQSCAREILMYMGQSLRAWLSVGASLELYFWECHASEMLEKKAAMT